MYTSNTAALKKLWPAFTEEIEEAYTPDPNAEVVTTASGHAGLKYSGRFLTSSRDPEKDAQRLIDAAFPEFVDIAVFLHFSCGYEIEALKKRWPETAIIVLEPLIPLFLSALHARDLSRIFTPPGITLIMDSSPEVLGQLLNERHHESVQFFPLRNIARIHPEYLENVREWFRRFDSRREINTNTLKRFGRVWVRNLFSNLPVMAKAGAIGNLQDVLKGIPALVLAAGPSLDCLIPVIKQLQERMAIIAVDTAAGWCRLHQVEPDFLVVVDPQYWNTRHLNYFTYDCILVSESSTYPSVFRNLHCTTYFSSSLFPLGRFLESYCGIEGNLGAGGSVSTTAWDLARFLGASSIHVAGLDLGYPQLRTHYGGSLFEELSHVWSVRKSPAETMHFKAVRDGSPVKADANGGGEVISDRRLSLYRWWFENRMKEAQSPPSYNLSDGGVKIEGMDPRNPEELTNLPNLRNRINGALKPYWKNPESQNATMAGSEHSLVQPPLVKGLELLKKSLTDLSCVCKNALEILDKYKTAPEVCFKKLKVIDEQIIRSPVKDIAGFLIDSPENSSEQDTDNAQAVSRKLYSGILQSIEFHLQHIDRATAALQKN